MHKARTFYPVGTAPTRNRDLLTGSFYASPNFFSTASFTHAGTNCATSPCRLAISRTIDDDRYMYCGGDMMNNVSSSWFSW